MKRTYQQRRALSQKVAAALTRALEAQPTLAEIIDHRVPAASLFMRLQDPWIVGTNPEGLPTIGPLGLINGVLEMAGAHRVAAHYDDSGKLTGFWPCNAKGKSVPRKP